MHVERYGAGPDVYVGLHGWGGNHLTFAPLVPFMPASASLYSTDLPGYGRSPRPHTWSAGVVGEEIAALMRHVGDGPVTLVGNCSGAIFALVATALEPHRVRRLVLIDPFAFLPWYFKVFVHPRIGHIAYHSTFANPVGRWLTNASLRNRRAAETDMTGSFRELDHDVSLRYLEMLDAIDGIARFSTISAPVDIAYGERTFAAVKQSVDQWRGLWPHARCWRLDGAGHLPIEEAAGPLAAIVFGSAAHEGRR